MKVIEINTSRPYQVLLGHGLIQKLPDIIKPICHDRKIGIVTDDIVDALYTNAIVKSLDAFGYEVFKYVIPHGEKSKNLTNLSNILEFFASCHFSRKDVLISIGGGVVGDITGLSAALYMRGIQFIQLPTTLLSMVDASVGGKTAIDLQTGKNLAGAFWQPSMVVIDFQIAAELPPAIFDEGMAEVVKCDVINKMGVIERSIKGERFDDIETMIFSCIEMKRGVVEQDEFETNGLRKVLNMGHTVAHAIEKLSNYGISHGKAVATGLVWEANIANKLGLCEKVFANEIKKTVEFYNLYIDEIPFETEAMVEAMKSDKKNDNQYVDFVLPINYGKWEKKKIIPDELYNLILSIKEYL